MAPRFRWVKYYNLPRSNVPSKHPITIPRIVGQWIKIPISCHFLQTIFPSHSLKQRLAGMVPSLRESWDCDRPCRSTTCPWPWRLETPREAGELIELFKNPVDFSMGVVPSNKRSLLIEWYLVDGLEHLFPYIGNNHPNWLIFFRGIETTNQLFFNYISNIFGIQGWSQSKIFGEILNKPASFLRKDRVLNAAQVISSLVDHRNVVMLGVSWG